MTVYETVLISPPDIGEESLDALIEDLSNFVTECGGQTEKVESWGKRELAYEIRKHNEGVYTLLHLKMPGDAVEKVRHRLKFKDEVLRYLIVEHEAPVETSEEPRQPAGDEPAEKTETTDPAPSKTSDTTSE